MPHRMLGTTGISVSVLGLGTVKFGRNQDLKYPRTFELPDDKQISELLHCAQEHGMNLLDTAPAYGESEARLGKLLGKQRKQWIICTKAGEQWSKSEQQPRSHFDFSPEAIISSVSQSRVRLATEYLDIVLLHSNGEDEDIIRSGALEVLAELKQRGWLRAFGMSTKTATGGCLAAEQSDVVMLSYRPDYLEEEQVLASCAQHRTGALIKKVFASGHQADIARNLSFALAHSATTSVLVSTVNQQHLRADISALNA